MGFHVIHSSNLKPRQFKYSWRKESSVEERNFEKKVQHFLKSQLALYKGWLVAATSLMQEQEQGEKSTESPQRKNKNFNIYNSNVSINTTTSCSRRATVLFTGTM